MYTFPLNEYLLLIAAGGTRKNAARFLAEPNEDSFVAAGNILAIADGVGENGNGNVASRAVTEAVLLYALRSQPELQKLRAEELKLYLRQAAKPGVTPDGSSVDTIVRAGNLEEALAPSEELIGSSGWHADTTVVVVEFTSTELRFYSQGDSFFYGKKGARLQRLNYLDRNEKGEITLTARDPGHKTESLPLEAGDLYVLCTDALEKVHRSKDRMLQSHLRSFINSDVLHNPYNQLLDPLEKTQRLVYNLLQEMWAARGDDATVIAVNIQKILK